jgi:HSP20 family protein
MSLSLWSAQDGISLRDAMSRLLEDSFIPATSQMAPVSRTMPLDVIENAEGYVVKASLPGCDKEKVEVSFEDDTLSIKATLEEEALPEGSRSLLRERWYGQVARSVRLPIAVDPDKAKAEFKNGVLTLTLPKAESVKPRTIKIG